MLLLSPTDPLSPGYVSCRVGALGLFLDGWFQEARKVRLCRPAWPCDLGKWLLSLSPTVPSGHGKGMTSGPAQQDRGLEGDPGPQRDVLPLRMEPLTGEGRTASEEGHAVPSGYEHPGGGEARERSGK